MCEIKKLEAVAVPRLARQFLFLGITITLSCLLFGQEQSTQPPTRDSQSLDILTRVVSAAGGQSVSAVRDLTKSGQITFHWGNSVTGPVTIRVLAGSRFRMDAGLAQGRTTWIVKDGIGSKKVNDKSLPISNMQAINLANFTTPLLYVTSALGDPSCSVSFKGTETIGARSVYRIRLKGQLGLVSNSSYVVLVTKDLLVDALTFDILRVEDHPIATAMRRAPSNKRVSKQIEAAPRQIDYSNFQNVNGLRLPFSIAVKLLGQPAFDIHLQAVTVNSGLTDESFMD
jgi:hypothetical protein